MSLSGITGTVGTRILGGSFSHRGWWRTGIGCPRRLWMPHPWRHSRPGWMWLWAAWSGGFNPGHSMILWFYICVFATRGLLSWSPMEGNKIRPLLLFVFLWTLITGLCRSMQLSLCRLSVCVYMLYMCVCVCLLRIGIQSCKWQNLLTQRCSGFASISLLHSVTPEGSFLGPGSWSHLALPPLPGVLASSCSGLTDPNPWTLPYCLDSMVLTFSPNPDLHFVLSLAVYTASSLWVNYKAPVTVPRHRAASQ